MPANFLVVKSPKIASTKVVKAKAARVLVVSKGNVPKASEEDMRRLEQAARTPQKKRRNYPQIAIA